MESHYCRKDSKKQYLHEGLSLRKMYGSYKKEKEDKSEVPVSEQKYEKIFNTEFNYSFYIPKKDM